MNEVRNIIIGFDLGTRSSQICYYDRKEGEPVSIPMKVGTGQYTFPNCLSKKPGEEEWHFGLEVEYFVSQQEEMYLDNIREICMEKRTVLIDGQERDAGEILGIFIKHALRILGVPDLVKSIRGIMITTPQLTRPMVENIRSACEFMGFSRKRCFLQDYEESFYYHTLYQKPEIWGRKVGLFLFEQDVVSYAGLDIDRTTKPVQVRVKKGEQTTLRTNPMERDMDFCRLIEETLGNEVYSSIFLVGDGFHQEWAERSVKLLCKNQRRVFYGNNLFAKGACCAAREKTEERKLKGYLYIGNDLVRENIGMEMMVFGSPAYYSLIQAGVNWYEARGECELILDETEDLEFIVSDMERTRKDRYVMHLPDLPVRPAKATRLRLCLEFESATRCCIEAEDLGFGDLYPSSGRKWQEIMNSEEGAV